MSNSPAVSDLTMLQPDISGCKLAHLLAAVRPDDTMVPALLDALERYSGLPVACLADWERLGAEEACRQLLECAGMTPARVAVIGQAVKRFQSLNGVEQFVLLRLGSRGAIRFCDLFSSISISPRVAGAVAVLGRDNAFSSLTLHDLLMMGKRRRLALIRDLFLDDEEVVAEVFHVVRSHVFALVAPQQAAHLERLAARLPGEPGAMPSSRRRPSVPLDLGLVDALARAGADRQTLNMVRAAIVQGRLPETAYLALDLGRGSLMRQLRTAPGIGATRSERIIEWLERL